jgi:hypothetical protein
MASNNSGVTILGTRSVVPQVFQSVDLRFFSSSAAYFRVWCNPSNYRIEQFVDNEWVEVDRTRRNLVESVRLEDYMMTKHKVYPDIWIMESALRFVSSHEDGGWCYCTTVLTLSSQWVKNTMTNSLLTVSVKGSGNCATAAREDWVTKWKSFCKEQNVTSTFRLKSGGVWDKLP